MERQGKISRLGVVIGLVAVLFSAMAAEAADSAVVFMYHRFGEDEYPTTSITMEQFEAHIRELKRADYTVLPVPEIIDSLRRGTPLPERTVGITVDDAYLSVYSRAWPRLTEAGFPFTLFVNTDAVDNPGANSMNWEQVRELADSGVTIGHHGVSHGHMAKAGMERNRREIDDAFKRLEQKLGKRPELFAYPYGESSLALENLVREAGFSAAFGQHSGAFSHIGNFYYLPRFPLNEKYGGLARFRLAANALALPVTEVTPADPLIGDDNPPPYGFTVVSGIGNLERLECFASHEGKATVSRLGETRIEVRMRTPMPTGRSRVNCTMPEPQGRWRWLGRQFYVP